MILAIAGEGPLESELRQLIRERGLESLIHLLGHVDDVPAFYASLDAFALNSLSEGMSNTILEAMSSGLAVVATAVGANPELVADGQTGFLVPSGDTCALAKAMQELRDNPAICRQFGRQAREAVVNSFSLERMVESYSRLYLQLLQPRR